MTSFHPVDSVPAVPMPVERSKVLATFIGQLREGTETARRFAVSFGARLKPLAGILRRNRGIILALLASIFLFYWFEVRPVKLYRACAAQASGDARTLLRSKAALAKGAKNAQTLEQMVEKNMYLRSDYESFLRKCLLYYGLPQDALKVGQKEGTKQGGGK